MTKKFFTLIAFIGLAQVGAINAMTCVGNNPQCQGIMENRAKAQAAADAAELEKCLKEGKSEDECQIEVYGGVTKTGELRIKALIS